MASRSTASTLSERDYSLIRQFVRERSGIELAASRRADVDRAAHQALAASGAGTAADLCAYLSRAQGRDTLDAFLDAVTVNESHFFRTRAQFEALRTAVLPELLAARRASRRLRVWSAGCATGEEPYSVAILIERLLPDIENWEVLVLATDISSAALATAERGMYRPWSFREVPPELESEYFTPRGDRVEVLPRIRSRVRFAPINLATDRYPSLLSNTLDMDLILCRNVLMYFSQNVIGTVLGRLCDALSDGGWLVVGQAEVGLVRETGLNSRRIGGALLHQKGKNA